MGTKVGVRHQHPVAGCHIMPELHNLHGGVMASIGGWRWGVVTRHCTTIQINMPNVPVLSITQQIQFYPRGMGFLRDKLSK